MLNDKMNCPKCGYKYFTVPETVLPDNTPVGMAYVPYQQWEMTYAENKALEAGTVFPSLDLKFSGKELVRHA